MADKIDARKAFEALAKIIGDREHIEIKLVSLKEKDTKDKDTKDKDTKDKDTA